MDKLNLYYATNRKHEGADRWAPDRYGRKFSDDGIENLRFGRVEVQATRSVIDKHLNARKDKVGTGDGVALSEYLSERTEKSAKITAYKEDINRDMSEAVQPNAVLGSKGMYKDLKEAMDKACDVVVLIHGFNVSWEEAVGSALALEQMLCKKRRGDTTCRVHPAECVKVVLFTWPSDGLMLPWVSYKSDRTEAEGSGAAVARGILKLRDFLMELRGGVRQRQTTLCQQQIHLLCHSMGNFLLQHMLERMGRFTPGSSLPRIFDHIFLCAADVDDDALEPDHPLGNLHQLAREVTIYHNRNDRAMVISDYSKGQPDRLGGSGAARPAHLHAKIQQVDCTGVADGLVQHSYYLCGHTNADIKQSIADKPANDSARRRKHVGGLDHVWKLA